MVGRCDRIERGIGIFSLTMVGCRIVAASCRFWCAMLIQARRIPSSLACVPVLNRTLNWVQTPVLAVSLLVAYRKLPRKA